MKMLILFGLFSVVLFFGCAGYSTETLKNESIKMEEPVPTSVIDNKTEEKPDIMPIPAESENKKAPENKTLGVGNLSIKESEIPSYNSSKDDDLKKLTNSIK